MHQGPHAMHGYLRAMTGTFSTVSACELLAFAQHLRDGWSLAALPPLVVALSSAFGAAMSWWKLREDNRRAEELHRATLANIQRMIVEQLPSRN